LTSSPESARVWAILSYIYKFGVLVTDRLRASNLDETREPDPGNAGGGNNNACHAYNQWPAKGFQLSQCPGARTVLVWRFISISNLSGATDYNRLVAQAQQGPPR